MYNHLKRCLIVSVQIQRKFSMQSIHENVFSMQTNYCTRRRWSNAASKRFYCQTATSAKHKEGVFIDDSQQRLDEFLAESPENEKLFKILELEVDVLRHNAEFVPIKIDSRDWLMLLKMSSKTQRKKYLSFLYLNEKSTEKKKARKELKRNEWLARKAEEEQLEDTGEIKYCLSGNSMFLRIYQTTISNFYNAQLLRAMMFEPKIVFDCDYESYMTDTEIHNCAKQLTIAFASNRSHVSPMCLYFCNLKDGLLKQGIHRNMPNLLDVDFPAVITSQSYLDLFPKNQLVYLTPHCRTDLTEYDPDMIYIIGAMVDKHNHQPLSLARAKKDGLRMAKFPIEKYLDWGSGSGKSLPLNQVLKIMLDIKHTRDWKIALQNVPTRKLRPSRDHMLAQKIKKRFRWQADDHESKKQNNEPVIRTNFTFASRKAT